MGDPRAAHVSTRKGRGDLTPTLQRLFHQYHLTGCSQVASLQSINVQS